MTGPTWRDVNGMLVKAGDACMLVHARPPHLLGPYIGNSVSVVGPTGENMFMIVNGVKVPFSAEWAIIEGLPIDLPAGAVGICVKPHEALIKLTPDETEYLSQEQIRELTELIQSVT